MLRNRSAFQVPFFLLFVLCMSVCIFSTADVCATEKSILVFGVGGDLRTLDPSVERGSSKENVIPNIADRFITLDRDGTPIPSLATAWEAIDDTTWKLTLRTGVEFHNGEPFNANAAKFSIERILDPSLRSDYLSMFNGIESVEVVDDYTILIHSTVPLPLIPYILAHGGYVVPPGYISEVGVEEFAKHPIGTGPYKFVKRELYEYILLEASPNYWGDPPAFEQVKFTIIPESATRLVALLAGEIDIADNLSAIQATMLKDREDFRVEIVQAERTAYLQLIVHSRNVGPGNEALQDKRVRQAIAYAIDVDSIIEYLQEGLVERLEVIYSPLHYPDIEGLKEQVHVYNYNPAEARRLLEAAGYGNGFPFVILYAPGTYLNDKEVAEAIVGYLQDVGIDARLEPYERATWVEGYTQQTLAGDAHWVHLSGLPKGTPEGLVRGRFQKDALSCYYVSEELSGLIDEILTTVDPAKRLELLKEIAVIAQEEIPLIPFYALSLVYGVSNEIEWEPHPTGVFDAASVKPRSD